MYYYISIKGNINKYIRKTDNFFGGFENRHNLNVIDKLRIVC